MALAYNVLGRNYYYLRNITKPLKFCVGRKFPEGLRTLSSGICYHNYNIRRSIIEIQHLNSSITLRQYSTQTENNGQQELKAKKPGLVQRFKEMYRDYWYVLVPVHMVTSAIWFGSFYYIVSSGVDVVGMMETLGVSEKIISPLKESHAGYLALTFALYKLVFPLRYAVTIGGTTYAIRRLTALGWIKPVPSRERIKEMLQEQKDNIQDRFIESKQHYQTQMKERRSQVMEEMKRYKTEMRNMKNKIKVKKM